MSEADLPLVTIVTPSYNQARYLGQAIESVLSQDYPRLEYIVVDGGSTDGSLPILEQYADTPKLRWLSEPDLGQADAINKGFRLASGDIFGWLNADDLYMPDAISTAVRSFMQNTEIRFVYGDALAIDEQNVSYGRRLHVHQADMDELVGTRDAIVQPAAFWKAEVWHTVGELDTRLKYALDYEYWMRIASRYRLHYVPILIAQERIYPATKTFSASFERFDEIEAIAIEHGGRGLPHAYHAEAGATYLVEAFKALFRGRTDEARTGFTKVAHLRPGFIKLLAHFAMLAVFGRRFAAYRTLWLIRLRNRLRSRNA